MTRERTDGRSDFEQRVRRVILKLGEGEVATYGEVAEEAGFPGAARAVGNVLAREDGLPWWRVVTSTGRLVPGHEAQQSRLLRREGVRIVGGRVQGPGPLAPGVRHPPAGPSSLDSIFDIKMTGSGKGESPPTS